MAARPRRDEPSLRRSGRDAGRERRRGSAALERTGPRDRHTGKPGRCDPGARCVPDHHRARRVGRPPVRTGPLLRPARPEPEPQRTGEPGGRERHPGSAGQHTADHPRGPRHRTDDPGARGGAAERERKAARGAPRARGGLCRHQAGGAFYRARRGAPGRGPADGADRGGQREFGAGDGLPRVRVQHRTVPAIQRPVRRPRTPAHRTHPLATHRRVGRRAGRGVDAVYAGRERSRACLLGKPGPADAVDQPRTRGAAGLDSRKP